ncbi:MAG: hypothetical protein JXB17_04510, partial [Bacteroidales bacterium]|nr:hypothetical protein [Bacteroidales bacterium]
MRNKLNPIRTTILISLIVTINIKIQSQDIVIRNNYKDTLRCKITKIDDQNIYMDIVKDKSKISTFIKLSKVDEYKYNFYIDELTKPKEKYDFAKNIKYELGLGTGILLFDEVDENLNWGFAGNIDIRALSRGGGFSFSPNIRFRNYTTQVENQEDLSLNLGIFSIGPQFSFRLYDVPEKNISITNFIELGYTIINLNLIYKYKETSIYSNQTITKTERLPMFSGKSISVLYGYRFTFNWFYVELAYEPLRTKVTLSDDLIASYRSNNIEYEVNPKIDFSSLNFKIGITYSAFGFYNYFFKYALNS